MTGLFASWRQVLTPTRLAYAAAYLALAAAFCWPLMTWPSANGTGDWDQHLFYYASVLRSAAFGQLPFWNPWYCGGNALWQNPQVSLISPVYALAPVMPLALAMKFNILGHYLVGLFGMHLLIRRIAGVQSPAVVVYLSALFTFSGGMALHLAAGHSNYLSVFWLPALAYCFFRAAAGHARSLVLGGIIIGVSVFNGGPHMVPLAAVLLGVLGLGAIAMGRTFRPLTIALLMVIAGCAYAAPKLVPSARLVTSADFHDRRPVKHPDSMSIEMLRHALWDASQGPPTRLSPGVQLYGWQEYGNYMGWFGAGLALLSAGWIVAFRRRREYWPEASAALGLVAFLLLAMGEFSAWAPASLMRELPFFSSFRIPSRHILLVPLVGALCMGFVARMILNRRSAASRLIEGLCVVGLCQLVLVNRAQFREVFILPPDAAASRLFERQTPTIAEGDVPRIGGPERVLSTNMLGSMLVGVSPLNCWEPLQLKKVAALGPAGLHAEGNITLEDLTFSPNHVSATVAVGIEPARLVLNQNFADGWSSNLGPVERDPERGRPSIVVPAGYRGTVAFRFFPPGLGTGWAIWALALGASVLVWRRAGSSRTSVGP